MLAGHYSHRAGPTAASLARIWQALDRVILSLLLLFPLLALGCTDAEGWVDINGFGCQEYVLQGACANGGYGPAWQETWGTFEDFAQGGVAASEACCDCGARQACGGTRRTDTGGDGCDYYDEFPGHCGCCDTDDFVAARDCCSCEALGEDADRWAEAFRSWPAKAVAMDLHYKGITGNLADAHWANLTALRVIDLSSNKLSGTIPPELGQLKQLQSLSLFRNNITGAIPLQLGQLTELQTLELRQNALSGSIPPELGQLHALEMLDMSYNLLSGNIPPELGSMQQLKVMWLHANDFRGRALPELGRLPSLEVLSLSYNLFSGSIPPEWGQLSRLIWLSLSSNELTAIPNEMSQLSRLEIMEVAGNALTGRIPPSLGQLSALQVLDLSRNKLTGGIPPELGNLSQLLKLQLLRNELSGSIPPELGQLSHLDVCELSDNSLSGSIPKELAKLSVLEILDLASNELSGSIPLELGQLSTLKYLNLFDNELEGGIPPELGSLGDMVYLSLGNNKLSGSMPPELGQLQVLFSLRLENNELSGGIPPELGQLTRGILKYVDLSGNKLSGSIPPELGRLGALVLLDLSNNLLTGSLPPSLGQLSILSTLHLHANALNGSLPLELGQLRRLRLLTLSGNSFSGSLEAVSGMSALEVLEARHCAFSAAGPLPETLLELDLSGNGFRSVPTAWSAAALRLVTLKLNNNLIASWPPFGVLPTESYDAESGRWVCGMGPLAPRLRWDDLAQLDLSGNPLNVSFRDFVWSLAYLPKLHSLYTAGCGLHGGVDQFVDMPYTGNEYCANMPQEGPGFPQLFLWDLSGNRLTSVVPSPPRALAVVDLSNNAELTHLSSGWYNLDRSASVISSLDVRGTPVLHADIIAYEDEQSSYCPEDGATDFVADPRSWRAVTEEGTAECTQLCRISHSVFYDRSFNITALCRCRQGAGVGLSCSPCPLDAFSALAFEPRGWRRRCRACPEHSSREPGSQDASVEDCLCEAGRYMASGGGADVTNATCTRCEQWPFRTTTARGVVDGKLCECNLKTDEGAEGFEGLLEKPLAAGPRCACPDGMFLNHISRRCMPCSIYEECAWGQAGFLQSLRPPAVAPGFWAEAPPAQEAEEAGPLLAFGGHRIWRCASSKTCQGGSVCLGHRYGRACSLCEPGFFGGQDGPCTRCPTSPDESRRGLAVVLCALIVVPILVNALLQASQEARGLLLSLRSLRSSLRQMVKFSQVMAITAGFNVRWPLAAQAFFDAMKAISMNVTSWLGAACLTGRSTMALEVVARWCIPLVAVLLTALAALLVNFVQRACGGCPCSGRVRRLCVTMGAWDAVRVLAFGLSLFFPTLLSSTLQVFTCLPPPEGHWEKMGWTVKDFPHVECGRSEDSWAVLAVMSGVLTISLVIVLPALVYRAWLHECVARLKSRFHSGGWWSFFFDDFRAVHMHWILVILFKDVAINFVACIGAGYGAIQLMLTAGISMTYALLTMRRLPYSDMSNSCLEMWNGAVVAVFCIFTAGMGFQSEPGVGDITEIFAGGAEDPKYVQRAWTVVAIQFMCLAGPTLIITYQLLMAFERTRWLVPKRLHPLSAQSRRDWIKSFMRAMGMTEEDDPALVNVLLEMDDVEYASFKQVMTSTAATLGMLSSDGSVRSRLSRVGRTMGGLAGAVARRISKHRLSVQATLGGVSTLRPLASDGWEPPEAAAAPEDEATAEPTAGPGLDLDGEAEETEALLRSMRRQLAGLSELEPARREEVAALARSLWQAASVGAREAPAASVIGKGDTPDEDQPEKNIQSL